MSWSLNVPKVHITDFNNNVDSSILTGQEIHLPSVEDAVTCAKSAIKDLSKQIKGSYVAAQASGHVLQAGEEATHSDHISVNVYGSQS